MSTVSYNRIVDVTVDVNDRFPTVANFSTPLLLTTETAGEIATELVRSFSSLAGLESYGFSDDSDTYKKAAAMLGTNYAPRSFMVGHKPDGDSLDDAYRNILDKNRGFYAVVIVSPITGDDATELEELNTSLIADRKLVFFDTNDSALRDDATDDTGVAAKLRNVKPSRMVGFYSEPVPGASESGDGSGTGNGTAFSEVLDGVMDGPTLGLLFSQNNSVSADTYDLAEIDDLLDSPYIEFTVPLANEVSGPVSLKRNVHRQPNVSGTSGGTFDLIDANGQPQQWSGLTAGDTIRGQIFTGTLSVRIISINSSASSNAAGSTILRQYAAKAAAYISAVDYNTPNSHYTLKFKRLDGEKPSALTDAQVQNLTGFQPGKGLDSNLGGFLNAYVCTASLNYVVEGIATDGQFVDLLTFTDWLIATMQANVLSVFMNNAVVSYDANGLSALYSAIAQTLDAAVVSGAATETRTDVNGDLLPAFEINIQAIAEVSPALQSQRIAPNIEYCLRYANGVHFVDIDGTIKVAN